MFKFRQYLIYIFLLLLFLGTAAFKVLLPDADDPILKSILNKMESFYNDNKQEKIFIQTDKSYYAAGDTIWLKGYVRAADTHAPSDLSNILHVALISGAQQEMQKLRLEITNGLASGYMVVPQTAGPENYRLVAYTRWMRNYDPRFSYIKNILVFNFNHPEAAPKVAGNAAAQINFFPEGGYLVTGLESKMAFKAIDSTGKSMAVTGTIVDNAGKTILSFKSSENGMGNFLFRPEAEKNYVATITMLGAKTLTVPLPKPLENGFVMNADNRNDSVCLVKVQKNATTGNTAADKVFMVARSGNRIVFADTRTFGTNPEDITFNIPKSNIPEGVAQLTLFSQDGKPQCERLIYVHHRQQLTISLKTDKTNYAPRENVTIEVEVKDPTGASVAANLSVSVTDENSLLAPEQTILSYLYLGSNIAGEIENAVTYFNSDLPQAKLILDNLLLTQGWRRFTWKEMLAESTAPKRYTPEKDMVFRARATTANGNPVPATLLNILMSGTGNAYAAFTDAEGNFSTILPDYETSGDALFRFYKEDNALEGIKVTPALEPLANWLTLPTLEVRNRINAGYWQKAYEWNRIQKAYHNSGLASVQTDPLNQNALYKIGQTGTTSYKIEEYVQFKNIAELFDEAVEPVTLKKTKAGMESRIVSRQAKNYFTNSPLYIVDGKPTFDNKVVLSLPLEQIDRIEVFNTAEHLQKFSLMGRDGVIAIYTKTNNLDLQNLSDSVVPFDGLFAGREFYQSPLQSPANATVPAFRPRLYWKSDIQTDASGKARITFKNADDITRYRIVVEGITVDGLPGVGQLSYKVVEPN